MIRRGPAFYYMFQVQVRGDCLLCENSLDVCTSNEIIFLYWYFKIFIKKIPGKLISLVQLALWISQVQEPSQPVKSKSLVPSLSILEHSLVESNELRKAIQKAVQEIHGFLFSLGKKIQQAAVLVNSTL